MPPAVSRTLPFALPAALAVLLLAGFVGVLRREETQLAGTNSVPLREPVVEIARGERLCQGSELVPAGARTLRLFGFWVRPGGHLARATLRDQTGRLLSAGALEPDGDGVLALRLADDTRTVADVTLCIENRDRVPLAFSGDVIPVGKFEVDGEARDAAVTALYVAERRESWAGLLPRIVSRVGAAHLMRGWVGWLGLACAVAALALAAVACLRIGRSGA
jgi:hypothetical protein